MPYSLSQPDSDGVCCDCRPDPCADCAGDEVVIWEFGPGINDTPGTNTFDSDPLPHCRITHGLFESADNGGEGEDFQVSVLGSPIDFGGSTTITIPEDDIFFLAADQEIMADDVATLDLTYSLALGSWNCTLYGVML